MVFTDWITAFLSFIIICSLIRQSERLVEKGRTPSNPSKFLSFFFLFFLFFIWVESFVYGQSVAQQETYIRGNKNSLSRGLCTFFFYIHVQLRPRNKKPHYALHCDLFPSLAGIAGKLGFEVLSIWKSKLEPRTFNKSVLFHQCIQYLYNFSCWIVIVIANKRDHSQKIRTIYILWLEDKHNYSSYIS